MAKEISERTRLQPNVFVVSFILSLRDPYALNTIFEPLEPYHFDLFKKHRQFDDFADNLSTIQTVLACCTECIASA